MTKYEAFEAIAGVSEDQSWIGYREEILKILDQIDPPPAEFTVREMVELMNPDGSTVASVLIDFESDWEIDESIKGRGIDSLRAKLIELAKPPQPQTIMVELPLSVARCCAEFRDGDVAKACKTALVKAGVNLEKS